MFIGANMSEIIGGTAYRTTLLNVTSSEVNTSAIQGVGMCSSRFPGFGLPFLPPAQNGVEFGPSSWKTSKFTDSLTDVLNFYAAHNMSVLLGDNIRLALQTIARFKIICFYFLWFF